MSRQSIRQKTMVKIAQIISSPLFPIIITEIHSNHSLFHSFIHSFLREKLEYLLCTRQHTGYLKKHGNKTEIQLRLTRKTILVLIQIKSKKKVRLKLSVVSHRLSLAIGNKHDSDKLHKNKYYKEDGNKLMS